MRYLLAALFMAAALAAAPRAGCVELEAPAGAVEVGIGADADPALFTPEVVDILARHDVEAAIAIHSDEMGIPDSAPEAVTRLLNGRGVKVWAWFLLDGPRGPYASDAAAEDYYELWKRFRAWAAEKQLVYTGVALDFEPDKNTLKEFLGGGPVPDISVLLDNLRPEEHEAAAGIYRKLLSESHAAGFRNYVVVYMTALDDLSDGDDDLQLMFRTPAVTRENAADLNIDVLSTMLYRPNAERLGMASTPYFVYSYARTMKQAFPEIGTAVLKAWPDAREDPGCGKLIADLQLLKALGFGRVEIFSLEIILKEYGPDALEHVLDELKEPAALSFRKDPATAILRDTFGRMDKQLDSAHNGN